MEISCLKTWLSFLLFFCTPLIGGDPERIAHFEGCPSGVVAGWVNVISGSVAHSETDLIIPGIEPLYISRSPLYAPGYFPKNKVKESWNFPFMEKLERSLDYSSNSSGRECFTLCQGTQEVLYFKDGDPNKPENRGYKLDNHPKGFTNLSGGRPSGKNSLRNYWIRRGTPQNITLFSGSGETRSYISEQGVDSNILPLREVFKPNHFIHKYAFDGKLTKQGVTIFAPTNREIAYYCCEDKGDEICITPFGRANRFVKYKFRKSSAPNGATNRFLEEVERSDGPTVEYAYKTDSEKNGQLKEIRYPEQRKVAFDYWEFNHHIERDGKAVRLDKTKDNQSLYKVQKLLQPADKGHELVETYSFEYHAKKNKYGSWTGGWTNVKDYFQNVDVYLIDGNYRLKEVRHAKGLIEKFVWDGFGQLVQSGLCDGSGNTLRAKHYFYDGKGNVEAEKVYGNLTGEGKSLPKIEENGTFNPAQAESYTIKFEYTNDTMNLLLSEKHDNGLRIDYQYLGGTDLVAKKITYAGDQMVKTEHFTYNNDHCLIETIEDDGLCKKIVRITPHEKPFGYPLEKEILGWSPEEKEIPLESYRYEYNERGQITSEERRDAEGKTIYKLVKEYDAHGNCKSETDPLGGVIIRKFDANDNCIEEAGPRPKLVKTFSYDYMNRLTEESVFYDKEEISVQNFEYNPLSHLKSTKDEFGHETSLTCDRYGRPLITDLPEVAINGSLNKTSIKKEFDLFGNEVLCQDQNGHLTKKSFTSWNQPYLIEYPDGKKEKFTYTRDNLVSLKVDQDDVETRFSWDSFGRLKSKVTPFGTEQYFYQGTQLVKSVDAQEVETHYIYDPFGRLSKIICGDREKQISYDRCGYPCRKAHFEGDKLLSTEVSVLDFLGRVIESYVEDPSGAVFNRKVFVYDEVGNCIEEWDGEAKTTRVFDGKNRAIEVVEHLGDTPRIHKASYSKVKNKYGQNVLEKRVADPNGKQVVTLYDTHGKEATISHLDSSGDEFLVRELFYDKVGHLVREEKQAGGEKRTLIFNLDSMGRKIKLIEPLGKETSTTYTGCGKIDVLTKPDGIKLTHSYDRGRLINLKSSDGRLNYSYTYSDRGELLAVKDEVTGTLSQQTFSDYGDLEEEVLPTGQRISYRHDGLGRIISYSLPDGGEVHLTYNAIAPDSVTRLNKGGESHYTHLYTDFDNRGNAKGQQLIGYAGYVRFAYDEQYQLKEIVHPSWKEANISYDPVGNLVSYQLNDEDYHFSYDALDQLVEENDHSYTFDPFHNRTSKDKIPYHVNTLNELISSEGNHYTYDPNGNLICVENKDQTLKFGYDPLNRLIFIQKGEIEVHFAYDPFHRRISENGKPFYFFREQEIGKENQLRILGSGLADIGATIAIELDGIPYAPLHDHNGSITALLDLDGNLVESWSYTAYGEQIGFTTSPWTFSSKRLNPLTNHLSFGRRDYDPSTGRWTTPDPLGFTAGPNLYTYVSNRPLTHLDPLGLFALSLYGAPSSSTISAAKGIVGGTVDFGLNTLHGYQTLAHHIGIREAEFDIGERHSMTNALADSQAARSLFVENKAMELLSVNPSDSTYHNFRQGTSTTLEVASLATAAYGIYTGMGGPGLSAIAPKFQRFINNVSSITSFGRRGNQIARRGADFIVGPNGVAVPTSRTVLESGFQGAGFTTFETNSKGMGYILPNGNKVRIMEPAGQAPLRASFTNMNDGPINIFTGVPPQPPKGLDPLSRRQFVRELTHLELIQ